MAGAVTEYKSLSSNFSFLSAGPDYLSYSSALSPCTYLYYMETVQ